MFWTLAHAVERHLFSAIVTLVALGICAGLSWWIWLDRFNRTVPQAGELLELRGLASVPQHRNRARAVWFRFHAEAPIGESWVAPQELQVFVRDPAAIQSALAKEPVAVTAWVVRSELGRGPRQEPPSVMQLRSGTHTLLSLEEGQELRAERAAEARMSAWIAMGGVAVAAVALLLFWIAKWRQ